LALCEKKLKSENTNKKNCVQKYTFNKKRSEESSRNVCSADLKDSLGKEELYLRKIKETLCSSHNSYFVLLGSVHIFQQFYAMF
jgi:hypothetical protein